MEVYVNGMSVPVEALEGYLLGCLDQSGAEALLLRFLEEPGEEQVSGG